MFLSGSGGLIREAIEMGRVVRAHRATTIVASQTVCSVLSFGERLSNSGLGERSRRYRERWPVFYIETEGPVRTDCGSRRCRVEEDSNVYGNTNHALDGERVTMVAAIQRELTRHGCAPGPIDGLWGDKSRIALRRFASNTGMPLGSEPTRKALGVLQHRGGAACS